MDETVEQATSRFWLDAHTEIARARQKFPDSALCLAALTEEVGELAKAMLHARAGVGLYADIWAEAVQVAVMAARVATEGDPSFYMVEYEEPTKSVLEPSSEGMTPIDNADKNFWDLNEARRRRDANSNEDKN